MSAINRKAFFDSIRPSLFGGTISQSQVTGIEIIMDEWEGQLLSFTPWLAYMLATSYHETARTMQPIKEYGDNAYFTRLYDVTGLYPDRARRMGNTMPGDGPRYCGRGFVQLTWKNNYRRMTELLADQFMGIDLVARPDDAMKPDIAAAIMFEGMLKADSDIGDFTGRCLEQYLQPGHLDYVGARYVINGQDHAVEIAGYARKFEEALT